jgi:hypothetical protein
MDRYKIIWWSSQHRTADNRLVVLENELVTIDKQEKILLWNRSHDSPRKELWLQKLPEMTDSQLTYAMQLVGGMIGSGAVHSLDGELILDYMSQEMLKRAEKHEEAAKQAKKGKKKCKS